MEIIMKGKEGMKKKSEERRGEYINQSDMSFLTFHGMRPRAN